MFRLKDVSSLLISLSIWHILAFSAAAQRADGQYWPCNPMKNTTCTPNKGLGEWSYFIDFTDPKANVGRDWSTSNFATITYNTKDKKGAEFTFNQRGDAPQLFTKFYIFYGRVDVEMQVAPGTGIISSFVLMSDDFDEIDWEMSGNNFNLQSKYPGGVVQNNYFPKGITGAYDRGLYVPCASPQTQMHTYSVDWTPTKLDWLIDGKVVRTFLAKDADKDTHQYPQTPSKIQLGLWDGGDPQQNQGTIQWAGGVTDLTKAPFTMFVKSVKVTNYTPAKSYSWSDQSGSSGSIKPSNVSTEVHPPSPKLSTDGRCGIASNSICYSSSLGSCCSAFGYCGNGPEYCGLPGCQIGWGHCGSQYPKANTDPKSSTTANKPAARGMSLPAEDPGAQNGKSSSVDSDPATTEQSAADVPHGSRDAQTKSGSENCYWWMGSYCDNSRRAYPVDVQ
ncbi:concanavalin A-like lectin/glucanase domain-containing protein [Xylariomycetidae sp. FL2044]|nr:concanavalin A-like lectin/glucanase domain-containing protein [Xylariomycetidae sp. FL2044]